MCGQCCGDGCRFRGGCVVFSGSALIVLGLFGAAVAIAMDVLYAGYIFAPVVMINAPLWGGVFIIVTGGLAVCSGKNPDRFGKKVSVLVMSIFAIMAAMTIWILAAIGLAVDAPQCEYYRWGPGRWFSEWAYWNMSKDSWKNIKCDPAYALHALQLVIGLLEVAFALALSIMSCCGTCCAPPRSDAPTAVYKPGGQVIIIQGGGQPSPQPGQHYTPGQPPYPVQPMPAQQPYPGQPIPGQQQPYPVQQMSGQQQYPGQPSPGQQQYPGQPPYPVQPMPGQQQLPYPQQQQYSAPPPVVAGEIPSAPLPSYENAVKDEPK